MVQPLWKIKSWHIFQFLIVWNTYFLYDPGIAFLEHLPKRNYSNTHTTICMQIFTAAVFIITQNWKQPKCLSCVNVGKQIMVQSYKHDSALGRKKPADICNNMNESQKHNVSERNQNQRLYTIWFHLYNILEKVKL